MKQLDKTIPSMEVAEMINKQHFHLMRDIRGYVAVLDENPKLDSRQFFIESTYKTAQGKEAACFLLTKLGCEMVANKMTGEKGILFTAEYTVRFNAMEDHIRNQQQQTPALPQNYKEALQHLLIQVERNEQLELENQQKQQIIGELKPKADYTDTILKSKKLLTITQIAKDYGMSAQAMNKKLAELNVQYYKSGQWLLYSNYHAKGYTHSETASFTRTDGRPDTNMYTKWTQKGRLFIYDLLKKHGILPTVEQEV